MSKVQFLTLGDLFRIALSSGAAGPAVILDAFKWRQDAVKALAVSLLTAGLSLLATVLVAVTKLETDPSRPAVAVITVGAVVAVSLSATLLVRLRHLHRDYVEALLLYDLVLPLV